ncbi:nitroreductase family protein [Dyadobacter subterraneus]|uniref:Nitroreductase family protein n=1 Tax=Dyadobacter subterraneus TaxID=2773304 RepID=A0ABR9WFY5_9BACT|nr:nitroreductase family protein [Dyadobacter subterraneus]MBE9464034.1 nitroreductase family protein [Dyadobacter subterraneus]
MSHIKIANTEHDVLDLIKNRWSPRSFSDKVIPENDLHTILEAAGWAASANNEQPWQYYYASKGHDGFVQITESLAGGNKPWAQHADVLIVSVARKTFEANQSENGAAMHDLGMANAHLLLQASALNIYSHMMGGFDKAKISETLDLTENQFPVAIIALGYLDEAEKLEEPFKTRELSPRVRKPLNEFVFSKN